MIKDILTDIVAHTHALGFINTIKVTTEDGETVIDSISEDKNVIINAKTMTSLLALAAKPTIMPLLFLPIITLFQLP